MRLLKPKLDFINSPDAMPFSEILTNPVLARALSAALLQFVHDRPQLEGLEAACRQNYEIHGARQFVTTFLNLLDPGDPDPKVPDKQNLTWKHQPRRHQSQPPNPPPQA